MAAITLKVTDATGARVNAVEVPNDQPNIRIMAALVQKLKLPLVGPDQQPMSYRFHHVESQSQLRDNDTLAASGVAEGDTLRLVPEIVAG